MCVYYNKILCLAVKELQHKQAQKHCHSFWTLHFVEDLSPWMWWELILSQSNGDVEAVVKRDVPMMTCPEFDKINRPVEYCVLTCFQHRTDGADGKTSSGNIDSLPHISDGALVLHKTKDTIKKQLHKQLKTWRKNSGEKNWRHVLTLFSTSYQPEKSKYVFKFQHNHLQIIMHFF